MKEILTKARELGLMIADSKQMQAVRDAEALVLEDPASYALLEGFQDAQKELQIVKGLAEDNPLRLNIETQYKTAFEKAMDDEKVKTWFEARRSYDNLVKTVNSVLAYLIAGEEENGCSSSGCSSCNGCG